MKRLCLILAYLFLFTQTASAMPLLVGQKVVYRGTITDLRISAVDGTAFIDNAGATIPTYADGNHSIEIYDSSNRMLRGVLKAAGTGETYSSDLFAGWDFTSGWNYGPTTTINSSSQFTTSATTGYVGKPSIITTNALYRGTLLATTTASVVQFRDNTSTKTYYNYGTTNGYFNAINAGVTIYIFGSTGCSCTVGTLSLAKVLTPSSSGCTIVSAKGGTTYNFSYKNASFTYNAASYYVIIRAIR